VTDMRAGSINTTSDTIHALELYELALSLVQTKGAPVPIGKETVLEYRAGNLTIHYLPKSGHLDVWDRRKVLTIERYRGSPRVERYVPGYWEDELEAALAKSRCKA
jgi:hypothetical protein